MSIFMPAFLPILPTSKNKSAFSIGNFFVHLLCTHTILLSLMSHLLLLAAHNWANLLLMIITKENVHIPFDVIIKLYLVFPSNDNSIQHAIFEQHLLLISSSGRRRPCWQHHDVATGTSMRQTCFRHCCNVLLAPKYNWTVWKATYQMIP